VCVLCVCCVCMYIYSVVFSVLQCVIAPAFSVLSVKNLSFENKFIVVLSL